MDPDPKPPAASMPSQPSWIAPIQPIVPDHELIKRIGGGSYGDVWLARNVVGTWRAVKVVFRDRFMDSRPYDREFAGMQKFEPLSRSNEGFIDILQIGRNDADGYFYYVMELADDAAGVIPFFQPGSGPILPAKSAPTGTSAVREAGEPTGESQTRTTPTGTSALQPETYVPLTLSKALLQRSRLPLNECLELGMTLNLALAHLHRAGLIHRDIKPSNIIFVGGVPKLADIGLVIETSEARSYVGTEGFIPPEGPNTPQADLFSLGKVLYEAGMGKDRKDFPEPFTQLIEAPDATKLLEFNAVLLKACAASVNERYRSAEEMNADLALLQSGGSVRRQRTLAKQLRFVQRAGALVTAIAALVAAGWFYQAHETRIVRQFAAEKTKLAEENRERVTRLDIANGIRLLDEGDAAGALLWFADALPLITDKPAEAAMHRIRIQQTLNQMPRPAQVLVHEYPVTAMAFSPDGKRIATGTESGGLHLWDAQTGALLWKPLRLQGGDIAQASFTPDGQRLLVSMWYNPSYDNSERTNTAAVIDVLTGKQLFTKISTNLGKADFSPDGRWMVTAEDEHVIRVFDVRTGNQVATLEGHTNYVTGFSFSATGNLLASLSIDDEIRLWRLPSGEQVGSPLPLQGRLHEFALSADGERLATAEQQAGATNSFLRIWTTGTGTAGKPIDLPGSRGAMCFDALTSRRLFVIFNNQVRVVDTDTQAEVFQPIQFDKMTLDWSVPSDFRRVAVSGLEGMLGIRSLETGEVLAPPFRHGRRITNIEFSPNGSQLAISADEGTCVLWNVDLRQEDAVHRFNANVPPGGDPGRLVGSFSQDRRRFLLVLLDGSVRLVDPESMTDWEIAGDPTINPAQAKCIFDPSGSQWAIKYGVTSTRAGRSNVIMLCREVGGTVRRLMLPLPTGLGWERFSPDGARFVTIGGDTKIRIWRTDDGTLEQTITIPESFKAGPIFPNARTLLLPADKDNPLVLFDLATGATVPTPIQELQVHPHGAWDPLGERFATVNRGQWGRIYSTRTGQPLTPPMWHGDILNWMDWSPDGTRILMAGRTSEVKVWDAATGLLLLPPLRIGDKPIKTATWSLDGRFIVARSDENAARVWDTATGEAVTPLLRHEGYLHMAQLVSSNRLITISSPNKLRAWDLKESLLDPDVLADYAQLASGRRLNAGVMMPITPADLVKLCRSLRARAPQLFQ